MSLWNGDVEENSRIKHLEKDEVCLHSLSSREFPKMKTFSYKIKTIQVICVYFSTIWSKTKCTKQLKLIGNTKEAYLTYFAKP